METRRTDANGPAEFGRTAKPLTQRNPKACEECRQRKVKCDGALPSCKHCQERLRHCVYRDVPRPKRREAARSQRTQGSSETTAAARGTAAGEHRKRMRRSPSFSAGARMPTSPREKSRVHYSSVAATHLASPSCELQLYYGPTANFSLLQLLYRHLTSSTTNVSATTGSNAALDEESREGQTAGDEVEEAGPGLDLFSFRRLFFGDFERTNRHAGRPLGATVGEQPLMFLPYELAERFLQRYLATKYHYTPFLTREEYHSLLRKMYAGTDPGVYESANYIVLLICMAIGASMMDNWPWADTLFSKARAGASMLDDVVNLQAVQVPLLLALFQVDNGRPNSAFLSLGTATRKAFAMGLHKGVDLRVGVAGQDVQARRVTLWSLFFFETWICFAFGRRSGLLESDITVPDPTDEPFIYPLVELSRIISSTASRIYGNNHQSLLSVWKAADQTYKELRNFSRKHLGIYHLSTYIPPKEGEQGFKEAALMDLYCHTVLLTFRPFLVFRVKFLVRDSSETGKVTPRCYTQEAQKWLDAACEHALEAARYIIRYVTEACELNELVREDRFQSFFLEGACFSLIYDSLLYKGAESPHLPWVREALRCLYKMIPQNDACHQTFNVFTAVYKMYLAVCPSTMLSLEDIHSANTQSRSGVADLWSRASEPHSGNGHDHASMTRERSVSDVRASPWGFQRETDWDFTFPTMDLESFLSVDPTTGTEGGLFGFADPFSTGDLPSLSK
ncbi:hypothetical protein VTO42DRAFT_1442 [Malbranchea cinnamomea]